MPNLDIFSTYYMAGMVQEIVPQARFFRDRYFPTSAEDIFNADKVLVEYQAGDQKLAPFVNERAGDIAIAREGYQVHEFTPPRIAPSRLMTLDDLKKRGFGEAVLSTSTPAERARKLQIRDLADLDARIARREEWMCAQVMINNGVQCVEYIDDIANGVTKNIYYYDISGTNPATYTITDEWDDNGDMWADVENMCIMLAQRGLPAADLVVGSDVEPVILADQKVQKFLDNRRFELGGIDPEILAPGVSKLGVLNFGGFRLNVIVCYETYDAAGTPTAYFPEKSALVTAPGCGHLMYGAVTQMEDKEFETFAMARVPKLVVVEEKDMRKLRLTSRPLPAPLHNAPWIYATNAVQ